MKKVVLTAVLAVGALLLAGSVNTRTAEAANQNMYRLYNKNSGEHFYTSATNERDYLVRAGWSYEGVGWIAPTTSHTPVYRLYNKNNGDHHYTRYKNERDYLISVGWTDENIGWYSDDDEGVPLYRQYNRNAATGSHNYTTSKKENDYLVSQGWSPEGIGWYGVKTKTISPIDEGLDKLTRTELAYRTVHVSFSPITDVSRSSISGPMLKLVIYKPIEFRAADISALDVGDVLKINGKDVKVDSIDRNVQTEDKTGTKVLINGGRTKDGGYDLVKDTETGYYCVAKEKDRVQYYEVGSATAYTATNFVLTDHYEKDFEQIYQQSSFSDKYYMMKGSFTADNTTATFDGDGAISVLNRAYTS